MAFRTTLPLLFVSLAAHSQEPVLWRDVPRSITLDHDHGELMVFARPDAPVLQDPPALATGYTRYSELTEDSFACVLTQLQELQIAYLQGRFETRSTLRKHGHFLALDLWTAEAGATPPPLASLIFETSTFLTTELRYFYRAPSQPGAPGECTYLTAAEITTISDQETERTQAAEEAERLRREQQKIEAAQERERQERARRDHPELDKYFAESTKVL